MTNPVFIYCPRSGDRVIAARPADDGLPAIATWQNGCRHVIGGVHLVYEAAAPRRHWRAAARRMAEIIIDAVGGVSWDDRGTIHLCVPVSAAATADRWMRAAGMAALDTLYADIEPERRNQAALALVGAARVWLPGPGRDDRARAVVARDGDRWRVTVTDRDGQCVGIVTAPESWGAPEVLGPAVETIELGPAPEPAEADA
jgi:hypothetical protein